MQYSANIVLFRNREAWISYVFLRPCCSCTSAATFVGFSRQPVHRPGEGLPPVPGLALAGQRPCRFVHNSGSNCCNWEGITCDGQEAVIEISLASRGLEGRLSPSLGELTSLRHLNLSYNSFSGDLPSKLLTSRSIAVLDVSFNHFSRVLQHQQGINSSLSLQVLNISSNLFAGEFSPILWDKMSNLVALNASNNSFQGWIPSSFCISSLSFAVLDLTYNQFRGSIPAGLGECSALKVLRAGHSNLTGTLPDELFNASSLEHLSFRGK